jgi:alpha-L-fucosidase
MKHIIVLFSICIALGLSQSPLKGQETQEEKKERMAWFADAKLGIFIHWGIYAVNGIDESWSFYNGYIAYPDYMEQLDGFTASGYDPEKWASLIRKSGAGYAVLTSKHHDGVALWDTEFSALNVVDKTPAGRDLIAPYMNALKKEGLKAGLYFSQLDWSHPDYPHFTRNEKRYEEDSTRWNRFLDFNRKQLLELCHTFKPDLIWFDGDWDYSAEQWKAKELSEAVRTCNPDVILNSRINGYGDYSTPEQGVPIHRPGDEYWELCMTMNDSWGYQGNDSNYKSANQIIRIFSDVIGMGGNLLLDIGPKADGTIPDEQVTILEELGRWTAKHQDAIYNTVAGLPPGYFNGPSTLSKDSTVVYLFLDYIPKGPVLVKGIKNKINRIWVEGNGTKLDWDIKMKQYWSPVPGLLFITVPEAVLDEQVTVVTLLLDGKLELHAGD